MGRGSNPKLPDNGGFNPLIWFNPQFSGPFGLFRVPIACFVNS